MTILCRDHALRARSGWGAGFAGQTIAAPFRPLSGGDTLPTDQPDTIPHTLAETLGIAYEHQSDS